MASLNPIQTVFETLGNVWQMTEPARDVRRDYQRVTDANQAAVKAYQLAERDVVERTALEQRRLAEEQAEENRKRQQALRRAVAAQQARFGAQGIDARDGSGEAVLLGLFQESDEEKAYRERLNRLRQDSLQQSTDTARRRNLLSLQNTYDSGRRNFGSTLEKAVDSIF